MHKRRTVTRSADGGERVAPEDARTRGITEAGAGRATVEVIPITSAIVAVDESAAGGSPSCEAGIGNRSISLAAAGKPT